MDPVNYWGVGRKQTPLPPVDFLWLWRRLQTPRLFDRQSEICLRGSFEHSDEELYLNLENKFSILHRINHQNLSALMTSCLQWYPKLTKVLKNSCSGKKSQKSWSEDWKSGSGFDVTFKRLLIAISHNFLDNSFQ